MSTEIETLEAVRAPVREMLASSQAFREMSRQEQRDLYRNMLALGTQLAEQARHGALATGLAQTDVHADQIEKTGLAGAKVAGAALRQVRFPEFVSSLIKGVFQSIVDSSIQQMQAYGDLLKTVVGTVEEFASKLSDDDAAMYAAIAEPDKYKVVARDPQKGVQIEMNGRPLRPNQRAEVLTKYKLEMARERRGLMREMVFMGINRVVVTDGSIHAKLVFHLDTTSNVSESTSDTSNVGVNASIAQMPVLSWFGMGGGASKTSVSTLDVNSTSNMSIDITGDVKVNFKSDYFPLESFAGLYERLRAEEPDMAKAADERRKLPENGAGQA